MHVIISGFWLPSFSFKKNLINKPISNLSQIALGVWVLWESQAQDFLASNGDK